MLSDKRAKRRTRAALLTLAGLKAWIRFVNHVETAFTAHDLAVAVTVLERFQRAADFHRIISD
jgi:hypothetical protein